MNDEQGNQVSKSEQERRERIAASRRRKIKKIITWLIVLAMLGGAISGLVVWAKKSARHKPGIEYPDQGALHIAVGAVHDPYNSNPPTSGPHYERPADWGFYDQPLPDEQLIHNLEHGGIWISYRDTDPSYLEELKEFSKKYAIKLIVTHRPQSDSALAVAAWTRLLKLENFDRGQIEKFIRAFINKGPEKTAF